MPHAFRGFASALALALCALPVACGSGDDNATPVPTDGGHDGTTDGMAAEGGGGAEGGRATDGGGATDSGGAAEGGGAADGGGGTEAAADALAGG